jgi:hypothetical protein
VWDYRDRCCSIRQVHWRYSRFSSSFHHPYQFISLSSHIDSVGYNSEFLFSFIHSHSFFSLIQLWKCWDE